MRLSAAIAICMLLGCVGIALFVLSMLGAPSVLRSTGIAAVLISMTGGVMTLVGFLLGAVKDDLSKK